MRKNKKYGIVKKKNINKGEWSELKVLFATTNPAKVKKYADELAKRGIELKTIKDIGINLNIEENGKNAIENAYIYEFWYLIVIENQELEKI